MVDDGFSSKHLKQLSTLIPTLDQIQAVVQDVVRKEIQSPATVGIIRTIVRDEVKAEVGKQAKITNDKIDALATKDQEDSNALTTVVVDHGDRIGTLEGFHNIHHEPAEA